MNNSTGNRGGGNLGRPFTDSRIVWSTKVRDGVAMAAKRSLVDSGPPDNRPTSALGRVLDWIFEAPDDETASQRLNLVRGIIKDEIN